MCCVVDTMWVGTEEGQVFLYDALTRNYLLDRHLALLPEQAITSITHLLTLRQVLVTRSDGCLLLFDEVTQEHKLPDAGNYDNRVNGTQLPVRSVFKTIEKLPIFKALVVGGASEDKKVVWCATRFEMLLLVDVYASRIEYCRKCYNRPRNDLTPDDHVADLALMIRGEEQLVWALTQPHNCVHCWSTSTEKLLMTVDCSVYSPSPGTHSLSPSLTLHPLSLPLTHSPPSLSPSLTHSLTFHPVSHFVLTFSRYTSLSLPNSLTQSLSPSLSFPPPSIPPSPHSHLYLCIG